MDRRRVCPSDHRSNGRSLLEKPAQGLKTALTQRTELTPVKRPHWILKSFQQVTAFLRDLGSDYSSVGRLSCSACQPPSFKPIEQPRYVGIAGGGAFSYSA